MMGALLYMGYMEEQYKQYHKQQQAKKPIKTEEVHLADNSGIKRKQVDSSRYLPSYASSYIFICIHYHAYI